MSANTNALFDASGSYDFLGFLLNIAKVVKSKVADAFVSPSERLWSEVNGLMESIASTVLAAENRAAILAATESARRAKLDARLLGLLESSAYASWAKEQEFEKMKNPQLEPKVANQHAEAFFFDIGTFSQGAAQYFKARQRVTGRRKPSQLEAAQLKSREICCMVALAVSCNNPDVPMARLEGLWVVALEAHRELMAAHGVDAPDFASPLEEKRIAEALGLTDEGLEKTGRDALALLESRGFDTKRILKSAGENLDAWRANPSHSVGRPEDEVVAGRPA